VSLESAETSFTTIT